MTNRDFRDRLADFSAHDVRFLIVGGYAVTFHARPRSTKDLDIWIEPSPENAAKVHAALMRFGAPLAAHGVQAADLATPGIVDQLGQDLIADKRKVGRPQDLLDADDLERTV